MVKKQLQLLSAVLFGLLIYLFFVCVFCFFLALLCSTLCQLVVHIVLKQQEVCSALQWMLLL